MHSIFYVKVDHITPTEKIMPKAKNCDSAQLRLFSPLFIQRGVSLKAMLLFSATVRENTRFHSFENNVGLMMVCCSDVREIGGTCFYY